MAQPRVPPPGGGGDCPEILIWSISSSSYSDNNRWFYHSQARMIAPIETAWLGRMVATELYRYEFSGSDLEAPQDAGIHVSRSGLILPPVERGTSDLLSPLPLQDARKSSLHTSGIRLRYAEE